MDHIQEFNSYIKNIKPEDKITVVYHGFCGDGVCSAIITVKSLERTLERKVDITIHEPNVGFSNTLFEKLKTEKINKVIFVDLAIYKSIDIIKKAEKLFDILVIDHHEYTNDLNSAKTTFIHSNFVNKNIPSNFYPASKLCYDLFSNLTNIEDLDWLSCLGLIADAGYKQWKEFLVKTMKRYGVKEKEDIFLTEFGKATANITSGESFSEHADDVFEIIYNANSHKQILNNKLLNECNKKVSDELKYWIDNRDKAERHKDLIIYVINPKYKIGSTLSTILSFQYFKNSTTIIIDTSTKVISDEGYDYVKVSARDQNINVKVNKLLEMATKSLKGAKAGGHMPAAGGIIKREDMEIFKKKLIKFYDELTSNKHQP
ncbi:DHH family phosphoesterase [Candidatus Woesearchaeota archaeon]|nr:DHH family phosphoesterase [Candidatus Woesearchaeota archaeon]